MGAKKKEEKQKPLEKMTSKELRDMAMELPDITGAHGMNKSELIAAIKEVKGIEDTGGRKKSDSSVRKLKQKMKEMKALHQKAKEENDEKMSAIYKKRYLRLKKKSRRAA